ncbi:MAG: hypothetical protein R3B93_12735 [Bacteroidia bacterium]
MMNISEGTSNGMWLLSQKKLKEMLANALKVVHIFAMSEYDKLDEFLQEKLKGREYAFKHAYWEAAEELIEADLIARKKRRRFFSSSFLAS